MVVEWRTRGTRGHQGGTKGAADELRDKRPLSYYDLPVCGQQCHSALCSHSALCLCSMKLLPLAVVTLINSYTCTKDGLVPCNCSYLLVPLLQSVYR